MRCSGGCQLDERAYSERTRRRRIRLLDRGGQFIELRDSLVELQAIDGLGDCGDRAVELALKRLVIAVRRAGRGGQPPNALHEACSAFDRGIRPFKVALRWAV